MEIKVICNACNTELNTDIVRGELQVAPCTRCLEKSKEEGYASGESDGYAEAERDKDEQ